jgi:hypothetical protein
VYVSQEDARWNFFATGDPIPEENVEAYSARRKRDRLNEELMTQFLNRLGASPWSEDFYAFSEHPCYRLQRLAPPSTVLKRTPSQVLGKVSL